MNNKRLLYIILALIICFLVVKQKLVRKRLASPISKVYSFIAKIEIAFDTVDYPEINKDAEKRFYAINLAKATEKMESVNKQSQKYSLNIERFEAVNGYKIVLVDTITKNSIVASEFKENPNLLIVDRKYDVYCNPTLDVKSSSPDFIYLNGNGTGLIVPHNAILSAGELGLICSARQLWKKIADSKDDQIAIVFEDDIILSDNFDQKIKDIFVALPPKWDIIYVDHRHYDDASEWHSSLLKINDKLLKNDGLKNTWGTHAYIINKNSAKKLLKYQAKYYNNIPLDNLFVENIRSNKLDAYISSEKIASVDTNFVSDITSMGVRHN
jgi:GR25 family glycosyltransferase involved in LPS biosynthesis